MAILDFEKLDLDETKKINAHLEKVRWEYDRLLQGLCAQNRDCLDFQLGVTGSRNPYFSGLLDAMVALSYIAEDPHRYQAIRCQSPALGRLIRRHFPHLQVLPKDGPTPFLKGLRYLASSLFIMGLYHLLSWLYPKAKLPDAPLLIFDCFLLPSAIASGHFKNTYYNGLEKYVPQDLKGRCFYLITFASIMDYGKFLKSFAKTRSDLPLILKGHYLALADYLFAFGHFWRMRRADLQTPQWKGFDLGPLVREDVVQGRFHPMAIEALLNYRFIARLKKREVEISRFVLWAENQPIDKAFSIGLHHFYPDTRLLGYLGFFYSADYNISLHPNQFEFREHFVPPCYLVPSMAMGRRLQEFCPDIPLVETCNLRYAGIFEHVGAGRTKEHVLVTLTLFENQALFLLRVTAGLAKKRPGLRFLVKAHPGSDIFRLEKEVRDMGLPNVAFGQEDTYKLMGRAYALISSTSGTCVEALAIGTPVIVTAIPSNFVQNTIPKQVDQRLWGVAWNEEDHLRLLDEYVKDPASYTALSGAVLEDYFSSRTDEKMALFFNEGPQVLHH